MNTPIKRGLEGLRLLYEIFVPSWTASLTTPSRGGISSIKLRRPGVSKWTNLLSLPLIAPLYKGKKKREKRKERVMLSSDSPFVKPSTSSELHLRPLVITCEAHMGLIRINWSTVSGGLWLRLSKNDERLQRSSRTSNAELAYVIKRLLR